MKCEDCKFFMKSNRRDEECLGWCHKNAPMPGSSVNWNVSSWPMVKINEFCGEFIKKAKNADTKKKK